MLEPFNPKEEQGLRHQLTAGQMAMVAVGGSIGTGLFLGSAPALDPGLAGKVAAVAVFGSPGNRFGTPLSSTGLFAGRAIDLCSPGDPVCTVGGRDRDAHSDYESPPYPGQAAGFVAGLV